MTDEKDPPGNEGDIPIDLDSVEEELPPDALTEAGEEALSAVQPGSEEATEIEPEELIEDEAPAFSAASPVTPPPFAPPVEIDAAQATLAAEQKRAQARDPEERLAIYATELDGETDPARQALLHHEVGEVHEWRRRDEAAAAKAYAKSLQADPTYRPNLWAIRRVFYRRGLWPNLLKLITAEIKYGNRQGDEAAMLEVEKAQVLADRMGDAAGARAAYEAALEANSSCLPALMALEGIYRREKNLGGARKVVRALVDVTTDPARKVALLIDLADLAEAPEGGLSVLSEAYEHGVDRERVLEHIERLAEKNGRHEELLAALERRVALMAPDRPAQRAAIFRQQAQIARIDLGDASRALAYLELALGELPADRLLLMEATEAAEAAGRAAQAAALYGRRIEIADDAEKPQLAFARALMLSRAGDEAQAEYVLAELDAQSPEFFPLHAALERRGLVRGDWAALAALYEAEGDRAAAGGFGVPADAQWAASAYAAAGEVHERRLGDDERAEALFRKALEKVPAHRAATDSLEGLLSRAGRWDVLAALYEGEREHGAKGERSDYLDEALARLYRGQLDDGTRAEITLRRIAERHPEDVRPRRRLAQLYAETSRFAELAAELSELASRASGDEKIALEIECADLAERAGDVARAAALYREVLAAHPGHPVASAALEQVLRRDGNWEDLISLLRDAVGAADDDGAAVAVLYRIAEVYEREVGKPAEAARVYGEILKRTPKDGAALRLLMRTLGATADSAGAAAALEAEIPLLEPGRARAEGYVRLGEVFEDRLGDETRAEQAYGRADQQDGTLRDAALGLVRVRARRRDWAELANAYASLAAACGDEDATARMLYEAEAAHLRGEAAEGESVGARVGVYLATRGGGHAGEAAGQLAQATQDDALAAALYTAAALGELGGGRDARAALHAALERQPGAEPAAWLLAQVGNGDAAERATALERAAALAEPEMRAALEMDRALALEECGRPRAAAQAAGAVLAHDVRNVAALSLLQKLCRAAGDREGLWKACAHLGTALLDKQAAAAVFLEGAQVLDRELSRPGDAAPLYREALERTPEDEETFDRVHDILVETARYADLEELLGHKLATTAEPGAKIPLYAERADLRLEQTNDRAGAARDFEALLELDPDHLESLRKLGELYAQENHVPQAVHYLERFLAGADSVPALRHSIHIKVAELSELKLKDMRRAIMHLRKAADLQPEDPAAHERLAQLYVRSRDYPHAIDALRKFAAARGEPRIAAQCELKAGQIYRDNVRDLSAARRAFEKARDLDPAFIEAVAELQALYTKQGDESARRVLLQKSLSHVRGALTQNPLQPELVKALCRVAEWGGSAESRYQAVELAAFFNVATPSDEQFFASHRAGRPAEPSRNLSQEGRERLDSPDLGTAWADVWAAIAEATHEIFGPQLQSFGVGRGERHVDRPGSTVALVFRLAAALGAPLQEIYVAQQADLCAASGVDPGVLVVGQSMTGTPSSRVRYRLGRMLAYLMNRAAPLASLSPDEARLLLTAAAQLGGAAAPRALAGPALEDRVRRLDKAIGRKERKQLTALAPRIGQAGDPATFLRALGQTAVRTGLLVCGDLAAAMEEAQPGLEPAGTRRFKTTEDLLADLGNADDAVEVLRLAASDDLLALRRELGWM
jgi:lipopolysaccharide biosynthesis regulator YciM